MDVKIENMIGVSQGHLGIVLTTIIQLEVRD
jgi:hypothetical protein